MVLEYNGIAVESEAYLRRILKTKASGTNVPNLIYLQDEKAWNLEVYLSRSTIEELTSKLESEKLPLIAVVETAALSYWKESTAHVLVVVGFDLQHVIVNDPYFDNDEIKIPLVQFQQAWSAFQNLVVMIKRREA